MTDSPVNESTYRRWWEPLRSFLDWIDTGKLALAAIIWYGFLWISYNRFYEPLGISPNDVGLNYATILANSVGAAVAFLIPFALVVTFAITSLINLSVLQVVSRRRRGGRPTLPRPSEGYSAAMRLWVLIAMLGSTLLLIYLFPVRANEESKSVRAGFGTSPLRIFGSPAPVLTIRADPVVSIRSTGVRKPGDIVAIESLSSSGLLYMGQANGVIVLYNHDTSRAIYLPASSVILTVDTT
jgi:hypothetical protein